MKSFCESYLGDRQDQELVIYDLGSQSVNGSYRALFNNKKWKYFGLDLELGENVDIILNDLYDWNFEDASVDVLISGQAFEHIEFFWLTMREIARVLKPDGLCCIIAPAGGYEHRFPVDCWRFYPDGFRALAKWSGLKTLKCVTQWEEPQGYKEDNSDIWQDTLFIASKINSSKSSYHSFRKKCLENKTFYPKKELHGNWVGHLPFGAKLIETFQPKLIVELGTHKGDSYFTFCQSVKENNLSDTKTFAIDTWKGDKQAGFYEEDIFEKVNHYNELHYSKFSTLVRKLFDDAVADFADESIDLLHIDGLHSYNAVENDFKKWSPKVAPGGIILFHDVCEHQKGYEVWKLWDEIKENANGSFLFEHSSGLGVWRKNGGEKLKSEFLKTLFWGSVEEKEELKGYFEYLGDNLLKSKELSEKNSRIQELEKLAESMRLKNRFLRLFGLYKYNEGK